MPVKPRLYSDSNLANQVQRRHGHTRATPSQQPSVAPALRGQFYPSCTQAYVRLVSALMESEMEPEIGTEPTLIAAMCLGEPIVQVTPVLSRNGTNGGETGELVWEGPASPTYRYSRNNNEDTWHWQPRQGTALRIRWARRCSRVAGSSSSAI